MLLSGCTESSRVDMTAENKPLLACNAIVAFNLRNPGYWLRYNGFSHNASEDASHSAICEAIHTTKV